MSDENYRYRVKSILGQVMYVYDDRVILTQEGARGLFTKGLQGEKTYYYNDITSVQFKNCGWTTGFIEFTMAGGIDRQGGAFSGVNNDNRFTFSKPTIGAAKKLAEEMETINTFIQAKIRECKNGTRVTNIQANSDADEIRKFKELLNEGIITQEEFEAKKKQILGL